MCSEQRLSLGPNLIPFLHFDDGTRVLIRANILRQSLIIRKVLPARISLSIDIFISRNIGQTLHVRWSGLVLSANKQNVVVQSKIPLNSRISFRQTNLSTYIQKEIKKFHINKFTYFSSYNYRYFYLIVYSIGNIFCTNQSTFSLKYLFANVGDWVKAEDLLVDVKTSLSGQFAIGHNLFIGYIPFDGFNFEDGIIANETLVTKEIFTSIHVEEWKTNIKRFTLLPSSNNERKILIR